jgi:DNA-binding NarL/FixJ family response regulator
MTSALDQLGVLRLVNGDPSATGASLPGRRAVVSESPECHAGRNSSHQHYQTQQRTFLSQESAAAELIVEPIRTELEPCAIGGAAEWPLAARCAELDVITAALGRERSVVLIGNTGVGKTRLLRAALQQAAGDTAVATARPGTAAGSLDAWLGDHCTSRQDWAGGVACSRESINGRKMVLGIDDAHLLSPATSDRLHHLATRSRVMLIITVRSSASAHEAINRLWVDQLAERIDVEPFDIPGVGDVLRAKLGGHVDAHTAARLCQITGGNAQFLRELVDHAIDAGSLRLVASVWQWSGLVNAAGRLVDVVQLRLGDLTPDEAELINMLALAGSLEVDLPAVVGLGQVAESLNQRGIVVVERADRTLRLRLAYPLYNEVVMATMPQLTARRLRIQLADAIENAGTRNQHDKLLAQVLRVEAGQALRPARMLVAAKKASKQADFVVVERFTRLALHHSCDDAAVESALLLGHALAKQGRFAEVESTLAAVSVTVPAAGRGELARVRATNMATRLRRPDAALAILDEVIGTLPAADAGLLHATRAHIGILADRLANVVATGTALLATQTPESALSQALVPAVAFASDAIGDSRTTVALLDWCQRGLAHWTNQSWCAHQLATAQAAFLMGRRDDLATALDRLHQHPINDSNPGICARVPLMHAQLDRSSGRFAAAIDKFRTAHGLSDAHDWFASRSWILAQLAGTLAEAGQLSAAVRTLAEARSVHEIMTPCSIDKDGVELEAVVVLAHSGERAKAAAMARELAERCSSAGRLMQAIAALHWAARLGDARAVADHCAALASKVSALVPRAQADHVGAMASNDGDALAQAADRFSELGLIPLAAEAAAQACAVHRTVGRRNKMRSMATKCHELLAQFTGVLPVWVRIDPLPAAQHSVLTERESEIATLAAKGLSNRDIASNLVVSIRTVENHLQRAYGKLGITTRAHLDLNLDAPSNGRC